MTLEGLREVIPTITGSIVVVVGMVMAYFLIDGGKISGEVGVALITAVVVGALNYVFQNNAISRTAAAVTNGAATAAVKRARETENASGGTV